MITGFSKLRPRLAQKTELPRLFSCMDIFDILIIGGVIMLAAGLFLIYPPLALIVPGILILLIGLFGAYQNGQAGGKNK